MATAKVRFPSNPRVSPLSWPGKEKYLLTTVLGCARIDRLLHERQRLVVFLFPVSMAIIVIGKLRGLGHAASIVLKARKFVKDLLPSVVANVELPCDPEHRGVLLLAREICCSKP